MAKDKEQELQVFLPTEEDEEHRQDALSGQKDGCETQEGQQVEIQRAEEEESDDLSNGHSVAVRGESRGRWFSSCLRRLRCDAQKTDEGNDDSSDLETAPSEKARRLIETIRNHSKYIQRDLSDLAHSRRDPALLKAIARPLEKCLMEEIDEGKYEKIEKLLSPRVFEYCESDTFLLSMKVSYKLHQLADLNGPDAERFKRLANSVEEFTYCLLDSLNPEYCWDSNWGRLASKFIDDILDDAIGYDQKKLFTHPVVHSGMQHKWKGCIFRESKWKSWQLTFFCLFDLVLSPILLAVFSLPRNKGKGTNNVE